MIAMEEVSAVSTTIIVPAEAGAPLHAFGDTVQVKLSGEQTQGSLAVVMDTTPPGGGPPPHIHHYEDELFLIIEGRYRFLANGEWSDVVGANTVIYTPRGGLHAFQNVGDTPSLHWVITTPSGFEQFFTRCAAVFAQSGPPDMPQILAISAEHGLEYVPPLTGAATESV